MRASPSVELVVSREESIHGELLTSPGGDLTKPSGDLTKPSGDLARAGVVSFNTSFALNSGILLLKPSRWARRLLSVWEGLRTRGCVGRGFHRQAEQRCFERLLALGPNGSLPAGTPARVLVTPMQLLNSPWGLYVRHLWGGEGRDLRAHVYDDALHTHGVWTRAQANALLEEVLRRYPPERTCESV